MGEINWRDNWDSALQEAKKLDRRIVLELYMEGCPHCARMHSETHADPKVADTLNSKFVPVRLEGRGNMEVVRKFNVTGAPTTLILSPEGKELHRFPGFHPAADYLKELDKAA